MSVVLYQTIIFYKQKHNITIWISKLCHDTKAILTSVSYWNRLDQFCSTPFGERKIWHLCQVSVVRCWRMSQNLISKYLFLEQKAQSLKKVLTFLTKAGGSIHIFSESTHIEALIKPCKMMKIKKKSYLYNPNMQPIDNHWLSAPMMYFPGILLLFEDKREF